MAFQAMKRLLRAQNPFMWLRLRYSVKFSEAEREEFFEEAKRIHAKILEGNYPQSSGENVKPSNSMTLTLLDLGRFAWTSLLTDKSIFLGAREIWLQQVVPQIKNMESAENYAEFLRLLAASMHAKIPYPETLLKQTIDQSLKIRKNGKSVMHELRGLDVVSAIRAYGWLDYCRN